MRAPVSTGKGAPSMKRTALLPAGFKDLEVQVAAWALADENGRFHKRLDSSMEQIRQFYDAIAPRMEAVMAHLRNCPVTGLTAPDERLLRLALSYVEVSRVFEVWNQQDVRADFFDPQRFKCIGFEAVQVE